MATNDVQYNTIAFNTESCDTHERGFNTELPSPIVSNIGFTSAKITIPHESLWPPYVRYVNLYIKQTTESDWILLGTDARSEDIFILDYPTLVPDTSYHVKIEGREYISDNATFTTLDGITGSANTSITLTTSEIEGIPGGVNFDNPTATSVTCIYKNLIPSGTDSLSLLYREWTISDSMEWIVASGNVIVNTPIIVNNLTPNIHYQFVYMASSLGGEEVYGPVAGYITNESNYLTGIANPPLLENLDYPEGLTSINVTLPPLVGISDYFRLQISENINGPWTFASEDQLAGLSEVIIEDLEEDTTYYFRALGVDSDDNVYNGLISSIDTLMELPEKPDIVTFSNITTTTVTVLTPMFPDRTTSFHLERGIGDEEEVITWEVIWENINENYLFEDAALTPDTIYHYRVIAINNSGQTVGDSAVTDTFSSLPERPESVHITEIQGTYVSLIRDSSLPLRASSIQIGKSISSTLTMIDNFPKNVIKIIDELPSDSTIELSYYACNHLGCVTGDKVRVKTKEEDFIPLPDILSAPILEDVTDTTITIVGLDELPTNSDSVKIQIGLVQVAEIIDDVVIPGEITFSSPVDITLGENITFENLTAKKFYVVRWIAIGEGGETYSNYLIVKTITPLPSKPGVPTLNNV